MPGQTQSTPIDLYAASANPGNAIVPAIGRDIEAVQGPPDYGSDISSLTPNSGRSGALMPRGAPPANRGLT
eukprot:24807-Eustigmatos_ZCMA.PRE.1